MVEKKKKKKGKKKKKKKKKKKRINVRTGGQEPHYIEFPCALKNSGVDQGHRLQRKLTMGSLRRALQRLLDISRLPTLRRSLSVFWRPVNCDDNRKGQS